MDHQDSSLKFYLSQLHETPLLTRAEENKLLHNIEARQNKILHECLSSKFFKNELLELMKSQIKVDILRVSRKLTEDSPPALVLEVSNSFKALVSALEVGAAQGEIDRLLVSVSLSGTLIHDLVTQVKTKYTAISDYERKLLEFQAYFEVKDLEELKGIVENIRTNEVAKTYFVRKFETTEQRLMARVHDFIKHEASLKSIEGSGISKANSLEVKKLFESILKAEKEMRKFRDELIRRNLRLVISRAKKFVNRGLDFDDLVQEGNIGLIKAINRHDPTRGAKIGTHATWWIDQGIRRAISNKAKTVRIPTHIEFLQLQLTNVVAKLTNELGRIPNKEEISDRANRDLGTKVTPAVLERLDLIAAHKMGIEDELSTGLSMLDILPLDGSENPFSLTAKKLLRERVRQILGTLSPRTEKIIRLRFGIGEPHEDLTLEQVGDVLGMTHPRVLVIQNSALIRMKKRGLKEENPDEGA